MVPRLRLAAAFAAAVPLVAALAGCGSSAPSGPPATGGQAVRVVASTNVYGSIVRAVGGERVAVRSIIDSPDADPHEYEATPADAAAINGAALVVVNGGGYDDFATQLVDAASTKPKVLDVVDLSGLQAAAPTAAGDQPAFNEHVWYSLPTVAKLADRLAADLGAADPPGAATYSANAVAFKGKIDGLTGKLTAIKAAHAADEVAITEPVPLYLVQDAGLTNATPGEFSEAVEEGTDPSAAVLDETLRLFSARRVKALLPNAQTESPATKQVERAATAAGVPVAPMTETLPAGTDDYITWQGGQIDALAAALDKPA